MSSAAWYSESGVGYVGASTTDGLEWRRHSWLCKPGLWSVGLTGWSPTVVALAVMDDFGNLVQVPA